MNATMALVRGIVGRVADADGWAGPVALATVPAVPAVALAEAAAAGVRAVGRAVSWVRRKLAAGLRAAAERLDPVPVVSRLEVRLARLAPAAVRAGAPVILPMPSAAQVTTEDAPAVLPLRPAGDDLAAALEKHGSVRAAARALGVAESTLRGRCRKAGVKLPGRKNRR
jgi:hypothetical protein